MGGCEANFTLAVSLPRISISSSRTILMTCSAGESAVITSCPTAFSLNVVDKFLDHLEVDVGFQQRHADFLQRFVDVLLGERALSAQVLECALQFFLKILKHR